MKANRFAAIVLAAGFSRRMERFKPLLSIGGETITDRLLGTFDRAGVTVYLVVGWRQAELRAGIKSRNVRIIDNADYEQGMFTSVQAGLRGLEADYAGLFIMPVDIPLVRPFTIQRLLAVAKENPERIIYPIFNGLRGHPPFLPAGIIPAILARPKDRSLKDVLDEKNDMAMGVKVPDECILLDIDTPADYENLLVRFAHYDVPTVDECEMILSDTYPVSQPVRRHSFKVADVAGSIGQALERVGIKADREIIRAAAVLHDIAKGWPAHATEGGRRLKEMGFGRIGDIVAEHTDLPPGASLESKVLYLADKLVKDDGLVTLEERFRDAMRRYGGTAELEADMNLRRECAFRVKKELEGLIGQSLERLLSG